MKTGVIEVIILSHRFLYYMAVIVISDKAYRASVP